MKPVHKRLMVLRKKGLKLREIVAKLQEEGFKRPSGLNIDYSFVSNTLYNARKTGLLPKLKATGIRSYIKKILNDEDISNNQKVRMLKAYLKDD